MVWTIQLQVIESELVWELSYFKGNLMQETPITRVAIHVQKIL